MSKNHYLNYTYECHSPFPSREGLSTGERHTLATSYAVMTPFTLLLNGFLIFALFRTKQYRHTFARFILALSTSDFFIGALVQPTAVYLFLAHEGNLWNCTISWCFTFIAYILLNFSGMSIFMVSVDRFLRLRKSRIYLKHASLKSVNITIVGICILSVAIGTGCIVSQQYEMFCYYNMVVISINGLAAAGILFFYLLTWRNVQKQFAKITSVSPLRKNRAESQLTLTTFDHENIRDNAENLSPFRKIRKLSFLYKSKIFLTKKRVKRQHDAAMTNTVAAILICCCITYPPYFFVTFHRSLSLAMAKKCNQQSKDSILAFFSTFLLMFVNSTVNAILYSCHNRPVKELLHRILVRRSQAEKNQNNQKIKTNFILCSQKSTISVITTV